MYGQACVERFFDFGQLYLCVCSCRRLASSSDCIRDRALTIELQKMSQGQWSIMFSISVVFVLSVVVPMRAEVFSAMANIDMLIETEKSVVSLIEKYIETERQRLEELESYVVAFTLLLALLFHS
ncbi:unnamed protein product [Soboliphyme baturini]|uniref:Transmembrane protein n=1 Tax=Soboliphyme baturini TaxID=241478 RepID=A0A183I940_9BILA|nr:unnamed protein product [Soboliphyme baturini]